MGDGLSLLFEQRLERVLRQRWAALLGFQVCALLMGCVIAISIGVIAHVIVGMDAPNAIAACIVLAFIASCCFAALILGMVEFDRRIKRADKHRAFPFRAFVTLVGNARSTR